MTVVHLARPLDPHELRYLDGVRRHLLDVPRARRDELLATAEAHLRERPRSGDFEHLAATLGDPATYTGELRAEHGLPTERLDGWARWIARSRRARYLGCLALIAVIATGTVGVVQYRAWSAWQPDIADSGGGMWLRDGPLSAVHFSKAGSVTQATIDYREGREVDIVIDLSGNDTVNVNQVTLGWQPLSAPIRLIGVDAWSPPSADNPPPNWHPTEPGPGEAPFRPFTLNRRHDPMERVRLRLRMEPCRRQSPGLTTTFDTLYLRYQGHGHERELALPLTHVYAVATPDPLRCPTP